MNLLSVKWWNSNGENICSSISPAIKLYFPSHLNIIIDFTHHFVSLIREFSWGLKSYELKCLHSDFKNLLLLRRAGLLSMPWYMCMLRTTGLVGWKIINRAKLSISFALNQKLELSLSFSWTSLWMPSHVIWPSFSSPVLVTVQVPIVWLINSFLCNPLRLWDICDYF